MLRKVKEVPASLKPQAIERAVEAFVQDSIDPTVPLDKLGLYNQIIENIASVLIFKQPSRYVWIAEEDGEVVAWAMTHVQKDVDNTLCYWMTDAWVARKWRNKPEVKQWFQQLTADAKTQLCKHIIIPSSRGTKGYCRFLGEGWHPYVVLLKQDL